MIYVFSTKGAFTRSMELYKAEKKSDINRIPLQLVLDFTNDETEKVLKAIKNEIENLEEIIFFGRASIFKKVEEYCLMNKKEIKITWL